MPLNMEVKAKMPEPISEQMKRASGLSDCTGPEVIIQKDTFFATCKEGTLLKLREEENKTKNEKKNVLVAYTRESKIEAKPSEYILSPVEDVPSMIQALSMSNGKLGEVHKTRNVFIASRNGLQARIHLDTVMNLGDYIEFEVQMQDISQDAIAREFASYLCQQFNLQERDYVAGAYFEKLVHQQNNGESIDV